MTDLFHVIPDSQCILRKGGVFYQRKIYWRGARLYAAYGNGFIRLGGGDATSCPGISYESLDISECVLLGKDPLGAPLYQGVKQL